MAIPQREVRIITFSQIVTWIAGLTALYELIVASRVLTWLHIFFPAAQHRAISLIFILFLVYALRTPSGEIRTGPIPWYEVLLLLCGLVGTGYVALNYRAVVAYSSFGYLDFKGMVLALLLTIAVLESSRRLAGWALPIMIVCFMIIPLFQDYLPGLLHGKNLPLENLSFGIYAGSSGIFGTPLGVAVTIIITFVFFGRLMQEAGAGKWFIDLAMSAAGWARGGVAKATIVASGLFGMITGSPSSEVATIGSITIPMMIKAGFPPKLAAGIEAVAGTGGQFMPPVMGAIAFIMADWLGIPYSQVALAAFIPACLYYAVLFVSIHFEAVRLGLKPTPRSELPPFLSALIGGWYYLFPLGMLIYLMIARSYPPEMAGVYSSLVMIGVSFFSPDKNHHLTPTKIWASLVGGAKTWITVAGITAAVGILISSLEVSGLGVKFSIFLIDFTQGNLLMTLIFVGFACFVLGTGLESIPTYMTLAVIAAPALVELGVPPIVAHLYVIYWGLASFITPPECIAVYIACSLSGSKLWETGWESMRLGIAVFIVPFAFVYNQALLMRGGVGEIIAATVTAFCGCIFVAASMRGFFTEKLPFWGRALAFLGGLVMIGPTTVGTTITGLGLGMLGTMGQVMTRKLRKSDTE
jgi:TRAP transporter 4TM/12TM fusion protein